MFVAEILLTILPLTFIVIGYLAAALIVIPSVFIKNTVNADMVAFIITEIEVIVIGVIYIIGLVQTMRDEKWFIAVSIVCVLHIFAVVIIRASLSSFEGMYLERYVSGASDLGSVYAAFVSGKLIQEGVNCFFYILFFIFAVIAIKHIAIMANDRELVKKCNTWIWIILACQILRFALPQIRVLIIRNGLVQDILDKSAIVLNYVGKILYIILLHLTVEAIDWYGVNKEKKIGLEKNPSYDLSAIEPLYKNSDSEIDES